MAASINSVTTRGYSIAGGFVGSAPLVVTLGYGSGVAIVLRVQTKLGRGRPPAR